MLVHQEQISHTVLDSRDRMSSCSTRKGVKLFTGENSSVHWDDWLPTLEQAATWNNWTSHSTGWMPPCQGQS